MKAQILTSFALVAAFVGVIVWQEYQRHRALRRMRDASDRKAGLK